MKKITNTIIGIVFVSFLGLLIQTVVQAQVMTFTSQMDVGARGSQVTALQQFLASYPQYYPEGLVTGYYGPLTQAAVRRFQAANGIDQVGRVGPITLARINLIGTGTGPGTGTGQDISAPYISNINVQSSAFGTSTTATISFMTNESSLGTVYYSNSPLQTVENQSNFTAPTIGGTAVQSNSGYVTSHNIQITNLTPNTTYYYRVMARDAAGNTSVSVERIMTSGF